MTREVLYKGQRIDTKEWVEGDLIHGVGCKKGMTFILPHKQWQACRNIDGWQVCSDAICQFTGITDSKGVKVFESDRVILKGKSSGEAIKLTVKWDGRGWNIPRHLEWIIVLGNEHDEEAGA